MLLSVCLIPSRMTNVLALCKYLCPQTDCSLKMCTCSLGGVNKKLSPRGDSGLHGRRSFCLSISHPLLHSGSHPMCLGVHHFLSTFYRMIIELIVLYYRHCPQTFKYIMPLNPQSSPEGRCHVSSNSREENAGLGSPV